MGCLARNSRFVKLSIGCLAIIHPMSRPPGACNAKLSRTRWKTPTSTASGANDTISAAAAVGQSSSRSKVKKSLSATGTVLTSPDVSTRGTSSMFQSRTNITTRVAATLGAMSGRRIPPRMRNRPAPSMTAASSQSVGSCATAPCRTKTASGAVTAASARVMPAKVSIRWTRPDRSASGITYAITGKLARTRNPCVAVRPPRNRERASAKAAGNATATARQAANIAARVLVASSCQKVGSATPISAMWSSVGGPVHDGGRVLSSGRTPTAARPVQASGDQPRRRRSARPIVCDERAVVAVERGRQGRGPRPASGEDEDGIERAQGQAREQHPYRQHQGRDLWKGDVDDALEPRCARERRLLPALLGDRDKSGQQEKGDKGRHPPDLDRDRRRQREAHVADWRCHLRLAQPTQDEIEDARRAAEQVVPHDPAGDRAYEPRQEKKPAPTRPSSERAPEQVRDAKAETELQRHGDQREDCDVPHGLAELGVVEDIGVVPPARERDSRGQRRIRGQRRAQTDEGRDDEPAAEQHRERSEKNEAVAAREPHLPGARHSAVDYQTRGHHEPRLVGGEEECRAGNILGPAKVTGELPLADRGHPLLRVAVRLLQIALHERGEDGARQQGVDADAVRREVALH